MDELLQLEQEGAARRQARAAARKTPAAKAKRNTGRAQRNRGYRAEKRIEAKLARFGWRRVPLSGAAGGSWSGDLRRIKQDGKILNVTEVKHRESGWKTLRDWLAQGNADWLVLDEGQHKEALFVIPESKLLVLLEEAGYDA